MEYKISRHLLGVPSAFPITVSYSSITDINGNALPSSFNTNPTIITLNAVQVDASGAVIGIAEVYINTSNIGTSTFIANIGSYFKPDSNVYASFIIDGSPSTTIVEMTALEMLNEFNKLTNNVNIASSTAFRSLSQVEQILNLAQDQMLMEILPFVFSDIYEEEEDVALSSGILNILNLSNTPFSLATGIDYVKITDGDYCKWIAYKLYRNLINQNENFSQSTYPNCAYTFKGNNMLVLPSDTNYIDIGYWRKPTKIILNSSTNNSTNTNAEFNRRLCSIIVGIAVRPYTVRTPEAELYARRTNHLIQTINDYYRDADYDGKDWWGADVPMQQHGTGNVLLGWGQ